MRHLSDELVVGVDGSDTGRHALQWAYAEARLRGAHLKVVHAWSPPSSVSASGTMLSVDADEYEQWAKTVLDEDLTTAGGDESDGILRPWLVRGDAATVLTMEAASADLLVVGSRGRGGFKELLLGSVSHHCVVHATVPVAVIRSDAPMPDRKPVVVGVDGSTSARAALEFAMEEAAERHARLIVAHAWWVAHPGSASDVPFVNVDRKAFASRSRELIESMIATVRAANPWSSVDIEVAPLEAAAAPGLIELSRDAGLLVVGSRGRSDIAGRLLGSVSQQCVHHAPVAVVVVPGDRR